MLSKISPRILCPILGALMALAYAPFDIFIFAILSPALLLLMWAGASPARAFYYGFLFGCGMFGAGVYWLYISISLFGGVNIAGAISITALLVVFMALYPALVGYIACRWFKQNITSFLLLACPSLWVVAEWTRSWFLTGFPWLNLGYSQTESVLSGPAPIFGIYAVSWLTILIAGMLASLYHCKGKQSFAIVISILLLSMTSWSLTQVEWTKPTGKDISVALIQAAIPQKLKWRPELREQSLALYMKLSEPYWDHDLVIWPETAIPAYNFTVNSFIDKLTLLTQKYDTTFLSGIPSKELEVSEYYNSVIMLADGKTSWYHKQHLVPFGEYLPLKPLLGVVLNFLQIPMSDFSPGKQLSPLLVSDDLSIGISICYEDTFGEEVIRAMPDAAVLVNVSNDAWFGDSLAPHQHLQMARMRALETGRYMLRATNTGISAIIDEKGSIVSQSPQFEPAALAAQISLFTGSTPYARWGNSPVIITALLILFFLFYQFRNTIKDVNQ